MKSHPSWVCGLKLLRLTICVQQVSSHPSWVCGLKQVLSSAESNARYVTPFVGVWIETHNANANVITPYVTPFVGVWIETLSIIALRNALASHPSWVCGLKLRMKYSIISKTQSHPSWVCGLKLLMVLFLSFLMSVTPFVGVWIETCLCRCTLLSARSHPSWVCGLKQFEHAKFHYPLVTPFVGVWIETMLHTDSHLL